MRTTTKYHFIGNEQCINALLRNPNDDEAYDQLIERGMTQTEITDAIAEKTPVVDPAPDPATP